MNANNCNDPAFPVPSYLDAEDGSGTRMIVMASDGLSIRDWFAGMALQGLLVNTPNGSSAQRVCKEAFGFADLMLAERAKS